MKRKALFSLSVLFFITAFIIYYLISNKEIVSSIKNISFTSLFYLAFLRLLFIATNGLFLREFALKFNVILKWKEWFGLSIITSAGNYFTPFGGGMVFRAAYLKHRHSFPYSQFVTLLASGYLMSYLIVGLMGLLFLGVYFAETGLFPYLIAILFVGIVVGMMTFILFPTIRIKYDNRITNAINSSIEGWQVVKKDTRLLIRLTGYIVLILCLNALSFWVAFDSLHYPVSVSVAVLISLLSGLSILINITPGNLGIQEAIISLSSGFLGSSTGQGLMVSLLLRATTLIPILCLTPIFSYILTNELSHCSKKELSI